MKQTLPRFFLSRIVLAVAACGLPSLVHGFPFLRQELSIPEVIRPIPGTQTNPTWVGNYYMMMTFWHPEASKFCYRTAGGGKVYQEDWIDINAKDSTTGYYYDARHFKGGSGRDYVFDVRTASGEETCGSQPTSFGGSWGNNETGGIAIAEFNGFITPANGAKVEANTNLYVAVECQDPDGGFVGQTTHEGNDDLNGVLSVTLKLDGTVVETKTNTVGEVAGNETASRGFGLYEFWVTLTNGEHTLQIETVDRLGNTSDEEETTVSITVDAVDTLPTLPPEFAGPIRGDACIGEAFAASIAGTARDLDGDALTYSKVSGPDWLTIEGDGSISGTPRPQDAGLNHFTLGVSSTDGSDEGTLTIKIMPDSSVLVGNDFEDEVVGSQPADLICDASGGSVAVVEENGKKYLRMADTNSTDGAGNIVQQSFAPQSELIIVQFRMRAVRSNDQMYFSLFDADGNCALKLGCSGAQQRGQGLHKYMDPSSRKVHQLEEFRPSSWCSKGVWYNYRIEVDVNKQCYRFWVNDVEMLPGFPKKNSLTNFSFYASTGDITRFELTNISSANSSAQGRFDVDSIFIYGGQADNDGDGMPDSWEQQIIDADPYDSILNISDVSPDDDFDLDGLANFFEFVRGSDPTSYNSNGLGFSIGSGGVGSKPVLSWKVKDDKNLGVHYLLQVSTNLASWETVDASHYTITNSPENGVNAVGLTITNDYGDPAFFRLSN